MTIAGALPFRRPREEDSLYRRAFYEAPVAAALVSPDGRFVQVNRGLEWLLGRPTEVLRRLSLSELAPPGEELRLDDLTREQRECCIVRDGGEPLWVALSAGTIEDTRGRTFYVVQFENIADRKRAERKLRRLADHDSLTWLLNRRSFLEGVHHELVRVRSSGGTGALLLLDLDNFKEINDTSGHSAGDQCLRTTADILRRRLRSTDLIARLGGDEFAALLTSVTPDQAEGVAGDLTRLLRDAGVSVSMGVVVFDANTAGCEDDLIAAVDRAMYAVKQTRR